MTAAVFSDIGQRVANDPSGPLRGVPAFCASLGVAFACLGRANSRHSPAAARTVREKARKGRYCILNSRQRRLNGVEIGDNFDILQSTDPVDRRGMKSRSSAHQRARNPISLRSVARSLSSVFLDNGSECPTDATLCNNYVTLAANNAMPKEAFPWPRSLGRSGCKTAQNR